MATLSDTPMSNVEAFANGRNYSALKKMVGGTPSEGLVLPLTSVPFPPNGSFTKMPRNYGYSVPLRRVNMPRRGRSRWADAYNAAGSIGRYIGGAIGAYKTGKSGYDYVSKNLGRKRVAVRQRTRSPRAAVRRSFVPRNYFSRNKRGRRMRKTKLPRLRLGESLGPIQQKRKTSATNLTSTTNQCAYYSLQAGYTTDREAYLNTLVIVGETDANVEREETIDKAAWPGMKRILFRTWTKTYRFRNNTNYPLDMWMYECIPKQRTSISPADSIEAGFVDVQVAGGAVDWHTEPMFFPQNSKTFNLRYRVPKKKKVRLNPGDETTYVLYLKKNVLYDQDYVDTFPTLVYQPNLCKFLLIKIQGCITHDTTTHTNVGYSPATVDYISEEMVRYQHLTSTVVNRWSYSDGLDTVATPGIGVSTVPSADEIRKA